MFDHPDRNKTEQRLDLAQSVEDFLSLGGNIETFGYCVKPSDEKIQRDDKPSTRMKFTRKDDESIGFTTTVRSQPKLEMTPMSTAPARTKPAAPAAKPKPAAAAKSAAVPSTPSFDVAALVAQVGVARPANARGGKSAWVPVLHRLEPEQSYFIAGKKAADLSYVKKIAAREGIAISLYTTTEGTGNNVVTGVRLFRDAVEAPAAAEPVAVPADGETGLE